MRTAPRLAASLLALGLLTGPAAALAQATDASASAAPAPGSDPAAFMAATAAKPGIKATASGLLYHVDQSGPATGPQPRLGDQVEVDYDGRLTNGTVFDSSANNGGPATMTVGALVPAWNEALQMMRPGDEWTLYVPPSLGYGDVATGPIPANSVMIFRLKLLKVIPAG